eukprot:TRINITY_DN5632_c0_g1_i1.p4 TRINITY_DN5632_c0_g1~~TRINITY_DN5632_c0_g1_i1.p4  ORF type:complete len:155 (+),score=22.64 TRINITY_DN5632_c0_g1_i1:435-899(+)
MLSPYHPMSKIPAQSAGIMEHKEGLKKRKGEADLSDLSHIEVPTSPLRQEYTEHDFYSSQPFRGLEGYNRRQRYLRSYTFSRKKSTAQKVQDSLRKLRSTAWAVVACNYKPAVARKIKEQFQHHTSKIISSGRSVKLHMPKLRMPECFRIQQIS